MLYGHNLSLLLCDLLLQMRYHIIEMANYFTALTFLYILNVYFCLRNILRSNLVDNTFDILDKTMNTLLDHIQSIVLR